MRTVNDKAFDEDVHDIEKIMDDDIFSDSTLERVEKNSPVLYSVLKAKGFGSVLAVRIRKYDRVYGYLVCAAKRSLRIWQENECAIMYYLTGILTESV